MKRTVVSCLILGVFMLMLMGIPLQVVHIDLVKPSYAAHSSSWNNKDEQGQEENWHMISNQDKKPDKDVRREDNRNNNYSVDDNREISRDKDDSQYHILGSGNNGEHIDLYKNLDQGNDLNRIVYRDNKRDDQGQDDHGENIWGRFDGREKFRVKDDNCKYFLDEDEHGHRGYRHIGSGSYDDECDRRLRECEDYHKRNHCNVPEPSMFSLLGAGLAGFGLLRRRLIK